MYQNQAHLSPALDHAPLRATEYDDVYCFGGFTLIPRQRVLLNNGEPVTIGNRALSLLIALVARPGELLEKTELMALVWPRLVVEECNLRAQVVALRRALGGDQPGYVLTIPGRGYRFVAPVSLKKHQGESTFTAPVIHRPPRIGGELIGRAALIPLLAQQLMHQRLVTLTGPGGIGKSAMAVALANELAQEFAQGVCFVDLAAVASAAAIPALLAAALGVECSHTDPMLAITETVGQGKLLLILDHCDHHLETVTVLVERFLQDAPHSGVLIASREPLRASGEFVQVLAPLESPGAQTQDLSTRQALGFSAIQLFIERVATYEPSFVFSDDDVATVSTICRKLDNNPLAIELAAARVRTFGIKALPSLLDGRLRLQMTGRRNCSARHQTLGAALDWSYLRLSAPEQALLRQLSVFPGSFTLEAVASIVDGDSLGGCSLLSLLESLIDKSLLTPRDFPAAQRYHLLEITRAYAREKLAEQGETTAALARRAVYALSVLRDASACLNSLPIEHWVALYGPEVELVRATLDWACAPGGDPELGAEVMSLSVPLWLHMSLRVECRDWVGRGHCRRLGLGATEDHPAPWFAALA